MWVLVSCGVEIMIFTPEPQKPPRVVMPKGSVLLTLYATPNLLSKDGTVLKTSCVTLISLFKLERLVTLTMQHKHDANLYLYLYLYLYLCLYFNKAAASVLYCI